METKTINGKEFVQIKVPGVDPLWMAKFQEYDRDEERITNITEEESLKILHERYGKSAFIWRDIVCLQMRNYAQEKLGKLTDIKEVGKFLGISDLGKDEHLHTCKEVSGTRWLDGAYAGAFAVALGYAPSDSYSAIGCRCCLPCESEGETPKEKPAPQLPDELSGLKEQLAAKQHEILAHWMKYLFSKCTEDDENNDVIIPGDFVLQWTRQMNTPYKDLTEKEKDSDREQVDKFWGMIESGFLYRPTSLHDVYKNTCKLVENSKNHRPIPLESINANQTVIAELGRTQGKMRAKIGEIEKETKETSLIRNQSAKRIWAEIEKHDERIKKLEESAKETGETITHMLGCCEMEDLKMKVKTLEETVEEDIPGLMGVSAKTVQDLTVRVEKLEKHHDRGKRPDGYMDRPDKVFYTPTNTATGRG